MEITELLTHKSVLPNLKVTSKKQALQELSKRVAKDYNLADREVFQVLLEREKLGSTGIGNGIAIGGVERGISRIIANQGCGQRTSKCECSQPAKLDAAPAQELARCLG